MDLNLISKVVLRLKIYYELLEHSISECNISPANYSKLEVER